jgi:RNA polymerase sigma factor (sigma-70 family)
MNTEVITTNDLDLIINHCRLGDARQQKVLYNRFYSYAFAIASTYLFQHEEAASIVNDAFVKVFRNIHVFVCAENRETEPQLKAWIKKIVINTAIDELRRKNKPFESLQEHWAGASYADHSIHYKELMHQVRILPDAYRAVFNMYVIDGFKHNEIAQHLDITVGTSKSNLFKAKSYLRRMIKAEMELAV